MQRVGRISVFFSSITSVLFTVVSMLAYLSRHLLQDPKHDVTYHLARQFILDGDVHHTRMQTLHRCLDATRDEQGMAAYFKHQPNILSGRGTSRPFTERWGRASHHSRWLIRGCSDVQEH